MLQHTTKAALQQAPYLSDIDPGEVSLQGITEDFALMKRPLLCTKIQVKNPNSPCLAVPGVVYFKKTATGGNLYAGLEDRLF